MQAPFLLLCIHLFSSKMGTGRTHTHRLQSMLHNKKSEIFRKIVIDEKIVWIYWWKEQTIWIYSQKVSPSGSWNARQAFPPLINDGCLNEGNKQHRGEERGLEGSYVLSWEAEKPSK